MATAANSRQRVLEALRDETIGGVLLLVAALVALIWANSPWSDIYFDISSFAIGPEFGHLHLPLASWAADALLAVFFFVAGLELKHELVLGSLRTVKTAAVPMTAAIAGMAVPALIYLVINLVQDGGEPIGWGIPMATDIAFALAVLAVAGRQLPIEVRVFLLTLAVVDDLGAILVIAIFYTAAIAILPLIGAIIAFVLYAYLQHKRVTTPVIYVPLAVIAWALVHSSGVHATVAGIALGLLTRVKSDPGEEDAPAHRLQHRLQPFSAGFCVPVFAFFAAGVSLQGTSIGEAMSEPVTLGIVVGLLAGKPIGVIGGAWLVTKVTKARISDNIGWADISAVGLVAGIGFTVSLLVAELAFHDAPPLLVDAKLGVLIGSVLAAVFAALTLVRRGRSHAARSEVA